LLQSEKGIGASSLRVGATRAEVETAVGKPLHEWDSDNGVHYAVYLYDVGRAPKPGTALGWFLLSPVNQILGIPFVLYTGDPCVAYGSKVRPGCIYALKHELKRAVVIYDKSGKVREISEDYH